MNIEGEAKLLRVFVGESDKAGTVPIYEKIVTEARARGLAGATVYKGIMGFGGNSRIRTSKILMLSEDMPLVIEIADSADKIESFIPFVNKLFEKSNAGGLVTLEKAEIIRYSYNKK
ncbi:MAG TPA: DUF190 domain-containing protein [Ignavibacteriales bacterium]|nr:DUF190 domain-containing protein [Ignavibacteriales bacterium]